MNIITLYYFKLINFIIIFLICIFSNNIFANSFVYETEFYTINIENEIISDAKTREIDEIKRKSLITILKKILTDSNYKKLNRKTNISEKTNSLIKNIVIEDEFISLNKYSSKVKVNYDINQIIQFLRNEKINYTDLTSKNILFIVTETNQINTEGLSSNNSFYKLANIKKYGLINILYPDLSNNDRFILPNIKILQKDIDSFVQISKKYNVELVYIIEIKKDLNHNTLFLTIYNNSKKEFKIIKDLNNISEINNHEVLISFLNEWWKKDNIIDHSIINRIACSIKNSNIYELYYINEIINSITQLKSNKLQTIKYGLNVNEIIFYGNFNNFSFKLSKYLINMTYDKDNECIIYVRN